VTASEPLVSIVVPSKNSADTIELCLRSIKAQSYSNIEVIVVDNFSRDRTADIARSYGARVYQKGPERCSQLNYGVSKANGKYAYRVDSDFLLDPDVVKEAVETCERFGYDGITIHNTSDPSVSFWARVRKMERDSYVDDPARAGARFWRKEAFESVGGFDVSIVAGDDYDLHNRLLRRGYRLGKIGAMDYHIGEPKSMAEIFTKHYYYGQNIGRFIQRNQDRALVQLNPLRRSLIVAFSKNSDDLMLIAGFFVYHFLRYAAASLGILTAKLKGN
jgi:glycosyltransferase involved in cell wall biosynthesis